MIRKMEEMHFMCTTRDCNLKFDNEKQLIMHKKKHDMVLSLNKSNQCPSDETPTPTRFIRNCEAIGLFQDLQNVNPFEETFRQATEAVKKGQTLRAQTVSSLEKPAGEDLHTPHIDLKDDVSSSVEKFANNEVTNVFRPETDSFIKSSSLSVPSSATTLMKENKIDSKLDNNDVKFFLRMSNGTLVQITSLSNNFEILKSDGAANGSINISSPTLENLNQAHTLPLQNSSAAVKKKLKETLLKSPKVKSTSNAHHLSIPESNFNHKSKKEVRVPTLVAEEKETDRKKKSLERNRIAAMKCREKRKKWVAELREKYEKMCLTNQALAKEVVFLRKEVARLKGLIISNNQPQLHELYPPAAVSLVTQMSSPKSLPTMPDLDTTRTIGTLRGPREGLRLDIEGASRATSMDLDSPLVRRDEILSSVAPPTTPNERLISFTELDHESEVVEERATTTVIQVNPNALAKSSLVFS